MPLFESQQHRDTRLFKHAYETLAVRAHESEWSEMRKDEYIAWFAGGSSAAEFAVTNCEPLRRVWTRGDERKSTHLTVLFTMPVILRFYSYLPASRELGVVERMNLFTDVLTGLLSIERDLPFSPQQTLDEYLELAKQFEFEMAALERGSTPYFFIEMDYLLSRALIVLGQPTPFSLGAVVFPVPDRGEFLNQGGELTGIPDDLTTSTMMFDGVHLGVAVASKAFAAIQQDNRRENA